VNASDADFQFYFSTRPGYAVQGSQAFYQNEDTGVYFLFERCVPSSGDAAEEDPNAWATFNLNFFRPHFFATEARPEVQSFVERFTLVVEDPQVSGMGEGLFSAEGFLRGWEAGNRMACRAVSDGEEPTPSLPYDVLESTWRWNRHRATLQSDVGEAVFVPRILFVRDGDAVLTASIWTDAIPVSLPKTDAVILHRDELAPRKWLRRISGTSLVRWSDLAAFVATYERRRDPHEHCLLHYVERPEDIVDLFRNAELSSGLDVVSNDRVLDQEVLASIDSDAV
jgi:hypothetical protein